MRTTKRFTPDVLDRFRRGGRGQGTYERYVPWHRVSRSDPSSYGRSHLLVWRGRQRELLSDDEWVSILFATTTPDVDDVREQFPLALSAACHELGAYDVRLGTPDQPGTIDIATKLKVKHPSINGNGRSAPWVMTTDLLITLVDAHGSRRLLAVACKCGAPLEDKRTRELLTIERHYWTVRGVEWLLLTPGLYDETVELTLRNAMPWGLGTPESVALRTKATSIALLKSGTPLNAVLGDLENAMGADRDRALRLFWQAVWSLELPLDLRRGWRPHLPIVVMSQAEFRSLNPIASRRSAWI